ncbi:hypothetical protein HYV73_04470 [Candidatus Uhrbacteria bacterium]|nr:hypothetical protein [Candidatus Uhrbacteria bacterium]
MHNPFEVLPPACNTTEVTSVYLALPPTPEEGRKGKKVGARTRVRPDDRLRVYRDGTYAVIRYTSDGSFISLLFTTSANLPIESGKAPFRFPKLTGKHDEAGREARRQVIGLICTLFGMSNAEGAAEKTPIETQDLIEYHLTPSHPPSQEAGDDLGEIDPQRTNHPKQYWTGFWDEDHYEDCPSMDD